MKHESTTTNTERGVTNANQAAADHNFAAGEHADDRRERARQRWLEVLQPNAEQTARFDEIYLGDYTSLEAYGRALADQSGWHEQIAPVVLEVGLANLRLDYEGVACDLWLSGQVRIIDHADGMWLYRRHLEVAAEPSVGPTEKTED